MNTKLLSKYIVLESHPNIGGLWIGFIGTKRLVKQYIARLHPAQLDYITQILPLKPGAEALPLPELEAEFGLVWSDDIGSFTRVEVEK